MLVPQDHKAYVSGQPMCDQILGQLCEVQLILASAWVANDLTLDRQCSQGQGGPDTTHIIKEHINKMTPKMVPYSADIREASPCIRWKQIQKPQTDTMFRVRDLGIPSHKQDVFIKFLASEFRKPCGRGGRKLIRA